MSAPGLKHLAMAAAMCCAGMSWAQAPATVFPPPPARGRLEHVETVLGETGFQQRNGWWQKLKSAVIGGHSPSLIVRPQGLALSGERLLVADPGLGCVHVFDLQARDYARVPRKDRLPSPVDVTIDGQNRIHVSDSRLARVLRFDADGRELPDVAYDFERPTGMVFDPARDRLYVVDTGRARVEIFGGQGEWIGSFGEAGEEEGTFNRPTKIALSAGGDILVLDAMNFRIQTFSPQGEFRSAFGIQGDTPGHLARPRGLAVDRDGHVYISDAEQDAFQVFADDGSLLLFVGGEGDAPGQFRLPADIAIDGDLVCVADAYNGRVQIFRYLGD